MRLPCGVTMLALLMPLLSPPVLGDDACRGARIEACAALLELAVQSRGKAGFVVYPSCGEDRGDGTLGFPVVSVDAGGPADLAGVRVGDLVVAVNGIGIPVENSGLFRELNQQLAIGDAVEYVILRDSSLQTIDLRAGPPSDSAVHLEVVYELRRRYGDEATATFLRDERSRDPGKKEAGDEGL